jgi:hypothetical protein
VATRRGTEYEEGVRARDALLREYVYDRLRLDRGIPVTSAYWGDDAAEFRWDQASVPTEGVEAFDPATPLEDVVLAEFVDAELDRDDRALVPVAVRGRSRGRLRPAVGRVRGGCRRCHGGCAAALASRASRVLSGLDRSVTAEAADDDELLEKLVGIRLG